MSFLKSMIPDFVKNEANKLIMAVSQKWNPPPEQDVFQISGNLSPDEFKRAGNKLISVCKAWQWKPSLNPKHSSKLLDQDKQFLILEKAICRRRVKQILPQLQETMTDNDGESIIVLSSPQVPYQPEKPEDIRYYTMYITYDEGYHTPRMFFNAVDFNMMPIKDGIREDIKKEYLDKTLTVEAFPFIEGASMPTVHPCKHAAVLKKMSDSMVEGGHKVESHFALLIFLKFITSVIPTVDFDMTGDLVFK